MGVAYVSQRRKELTAHGLGHLALWAAEGVEVAEGLDQKVALLICGRQAKSSAVLWCRLAPKPRKRLKAKANLKLAACVLQRRVAEAARPCEKAREKLSLKCAEAFAADSASEQKRAQKRQKLCLRRAPPPPQGNPWKEDRVPP